MDVQHREFIWECDYGEHNRVLCELAKFLATQGPDELAMCALFVNNNPYNLEFFVVLGYESPTDAQIESMKAALGACGALYRPDITLDELMLEVGHKRFNMTTAAYPKSLAFTESLFQFKERSEVANRISMRPLGKQLPVFLSHSSRDKPFVEDVLPYLNRASLPVWYDKISIDYGETIVTAIQSGIVSSGAVVFFVTPSFLNSSWCKSEMEGFLNRFGAGQRVLLFTLVSSEVEHDKLPLFLQMKKYLRLPPKVAPADVARELIPTLRRHFNL